MSNSHTEAYVHFVWATWDREPTLTPDVEARLYACIAARCRELQAHLLAIGGVADHLHVLLRLPATLTVAQAASDLKGASSRFATRDLNLPAFRWQGAYSARSVSPQGTGDVCAYIEDQKRHHADKTTYHEWERANDTEQ